MGFLQKLSPTSVLDKVGRAQALWSCFGGIVMSAFSYIWDMPPPLVVLVGLAAFALCLIVFHRCQLINVWLAKSAVGVSPAIYIDCEQVCDPLGGVAAQLYSTTFCLKVKNDDRDGKVLRGMSVCHIDMWGARFPLSIRSSVDGQIDLRHGEEAIVEIGYMLIRMAHNQVPGIERGEGPTPVGLLEINNAYGEDPQVQSLVLSDQSREGVAHWKGRQPFPLRLLVAANDVPSTEIVLLVDLWAEKVSERIKIGKRL